MSEKLPLSDFYKLIDYVTIFKSKKWWEAIVVIESFGRRSISMYMWQFRDGKWKRKHKFQLRNIDEWNKVKDAVDKLVPKLHGWMNLAKAEHGQCVRLGFTFSISGFWFR